MLVHLPRRSNFPFSFPLWNFLDFFFFSFGVILSIVMHVHVGSRVIYLDHELNINGYE